MSTGNESILTKSTAASPIYDITPFTLLDYPDKAACIIWLVGCNMRCTYCYNPDIVFGKGKISYFEALKFVISRRNLLDGVVLSGGECSSHRDIENFADAVKKLGLLVKADTNGTNPEVIRRLIEKRLVDYVALDFKAPEEKFTDITGSSRFAGFEQTLEILLRSDVAFEVRTTVHSGLLTRSDLRVMIRYLEEKGYSGTYYLQEFRNGTSTIGNLPPDGPLITDGLESNLFKINRRA